MENTNKEPNKEILLTKCCRKLCKTEEMNDDEYEKHTEEHCKDCPIFDLVKYYEMELEEDVIRKAIDTYGQEAQLWMVIEEMSELEKEICKYKRGKDNFLEIADEMADVYIMLEQLKRICGVPQDLVQRRIDFKFDRLRKRLGMF